MQFCEGEANLREVADGSDQVGVERFDLTEFFWKAAVDFFAGVVCGGAWRMAGSGPGMMGRIWAGCFSSFSKTRPRKQLAASEASSDGKSPAIT